MAQLSQVQYFFEAVEKQFGFAASAAAGKTLHLSGVIAVDEQMQLIGEGDMAAQINQIYDNMEKILALNGATLKNVVNEMIFVTDMQALAEHGGARAARYAECAPPATTAVQVAALFVPGAMIEIQATALLD